MLRWWLCDGDHDRDEDQIDYDSVEQDDDVDCVDMMIMMVVVMVLLVITHPICHVYRLVISNENDYDYCYRIAMMMKLIVDNCY